MTDIAPLRTGDPARLGAYELLGRVGEGGQGSVFLGVSPSGERVAVKLLRPDRGGAAGTGTAATRFQREIEILRRVAPFCTAQVVETGLFGTRPYIVSEYVEGPTLQQVVESAGPLRDARLRRLAVGTMTALSAIHRAGVVHRDFKPSNVLLSRDGPRVIDFGIAREVDALATGSGVVGTPPYMAPEQFEAASVGPPADLFAWGSTMVFAATGKPPFGMDSMPAIVNRILHREPDLGDLGGDLRDLVVECLSKDPARRPAAKDALLRLLGARGRQPDGELLTAGTAVAAGASGAALESASRTGSEVLIETPGIAPRTRETAVVTPRPGEAVPAPGGPENQPAWRRRVTALLTGVAATVVLVSGGMVYALVQGGSPGTAKVSASPTPTVVREAVDAPATRTERVRLPELKTTLHEAPGDPVRVTSFIHLTGSVSYSYARDPKSGKFESIGPYHEPAVSPDGAWTAVLPWIKMNIPGPHDSIRLIERATGREFVVRTVAKPLANYNPFWSSDGKRILLTTYKDSSADQIVGFVVVDVATARATAVTTDTLMPGTSPFMWAPGESTVAVRFPDGSGVGLRLFDLGGKTVRTIPAVGEPSSRENTFSPAGKRFVTMCPDKVATVCVWDTRTARRQAAFPAPAAATLVGWYNDAHVMLIDRTKDPRRVVVVNLKGEVVRVLAEIPADEFDGTGESFIPRFTKD
ncbi:hypothetical protein GCM10010517_60570 [Streptosporangium fragile]|uniref:Protein kinase domain-containing protein n=1 Tax=Streptosporangium fragile TaxID=46186 RepID=A0ABN3W4J0_9ACTN